jgi:predicted nucleic acid-binding protein
VTDSVFFDTNVLVYAYSLGDHRLHVAQQLLFNGGVINAQVLNEFASIGRGKLAFSWEEVSLAVQKLLVLCPNPKPLIVETHLLSLELSKKYRFSIWDSLIIAAALEAHCTTLYTEDLQHGQLIEGLRIVNPFREPAS